MARKKGHGKFIWIKEEVAGAPPMSVIVKDTKAFASPIRIALSDGERYDLDQQGTEVGEVVAIGKGVTHLAKGDVILYRALFGYPIPNGPYLPFMYKVEFPSGVVLNAGPHAEATI